MTRVLMTADAVGGVWTYALELAGALRALDVAVHLVTLGPAPSRAQRLEAAGVVADLHVLDAPLEWEQRPWEQVDAAGPELLALADAAQADLVHLNGFVHAPLAWDRPVVVVAHSDVVSWWRHVHGAPPPGEWDEYRDRVQRGLQAADAVVALTLAGVEDLRRSYDVGTATAIPNGRSRDWLQVHQKEPIVLGAGRLWDEAKGLAALEEAATDLPWPVVLAGPLPSGRTPGDAAGGLRLLGAVPFPELASWMGRAAVYAAPVRYEPFGFGPLEAALSGCALVLGDVPSLHELWGSCATYVRPGEPQELHAALAALCLDPSHAAVKGAEARSCAARYTPERMAAGYAEVYTSLLGGAAPPRGEEAGA